SQHRRALGARTDADYLRVVLSDGRPTARHRAHHRLWRPGAARGHRPLRSGAKALALAHVRPRPVLRQTRERRPSLPGSRARLRNTPQVLSLLWRNLPNVASSDPAKYQKAVATRSLPSLRPWQTALTTPRLRSAQIPRGLGAMTAANGESISGLLQRARGGDRRALDRLFAVCRNYITIVARTQVESWLQAKFDPSDLVQQTLMEAYRGFDG